MKKNIEEKKKEVARVIVGAFIFNDNDELFLMKGVHYQNEYLCPGGHVELNESLVDALKREIKEETNMDLANVEFISISEDVKLGKKIGKKDDHHVYINYKAKVKSDKKIKLNDEATEYTWKSIDEWKENKDVKATVKEVLENLNSDSSENLYKRALVDYQNLVKRSAKEKQEFAKFANEQLLYQLIPV